MYNSFRRALDSARRFTYTVIMVGDELKRRRENLGMTQAELAKRLKIDVQTLSNWERDKQRIPGMAELAMKQLETENKK